MEEGNERINYKCNECQYEFSRKQGQAVTRCPYCGKENCLEIDTGDYASKVIDEVSEI